MRFCTWLGGEIGGTGSDAGRRRSCSVFTSSSVSVLAALAVVDAWLTNLPEPTPQTCMITAGAIAGKVFCDNDSEALGLRSMCGLFNNGKNGIQTGVGRYSQVNNNNVGRDVSMVITGRS